MRRDDDKRQLKNYQCVRESGKLLCVLSGNLVVPVLKSSSYTRTIGFNVDIKIMKCMKRYILA